MAVALEEIAHQVEHCRRVVDFTQQRWVIRRGQGRDLRAVLLHKFEFLGEIDMIFPKSGGFSGLWPDALDRLQTHGRSTQHG
jgi:hypothetical protein